MVKIKTDNRYSDLEAFQQSTLSNIGYHLKDKTLSVDMRGPDAHDALC